MDVVNVFEMTTQTPRTMERPSTAINVTVVVFGSIVGELMLLKVGLTSCLVFARVALDRLAFLVVLLCLGLLVACRGAALS